MTRTVAFFLVFACVIVAARPLTCYDEGWQTHKVSYSDVKHCTDLPEAINVSWVKIGSVLSLRIPTVTCAATGQSVGGTFWIMPFLPVGIEPLDTPIKFPVAVSNNGATVQGVIEYEPGARAWTIFGSSQKGNFGSLGLQGWAKDLVISYAVDEQVRCTHG
jgi:hypothetical protein